MMIKKNIYTIGALILVATSGFSQVRVGNQVEEVIADQNPFLDVSNYTQFDQDRGRGLYFPQTDLTTFTFNTSRLEGIDTFLTAFDGMVVYNTTSGTTGPNPATQGLPVEVTPGFYYFYNPNDKNQGGTTVAEGKWIRIGGESKGADYRSDAQPTGEFFWVDANESNKKPIKRQMLDVNFDDVPYTNVTGQIPENAKFVRTQLIDKTTGQLSVASVEFKPNSGDEFGTTSTDDYLVAKFGQMSTTLDGDYRLIIEYYQP